MQQYSDEVATAFSIATSRRLQSLTTTWSAKYFHATHPVIFGADTRLRFTQAFDRASSKYRIQNSRRGADLSALRDLKAETVGLLNYGRMTPERATMFQPFFHEIDEVAAEALTHG